MRNRTFLSDQICISGREEGGKGRGDKSLCDRKEEIMISNISIKLDYQNEHSQSKVRSRTFFDFLEQHYSFSLPNY